jgi:Holliday junction resolvase RusA-like endonuclease
MGRGRALFVDRQGHKMTAVQRRTTEFGQQVFVTIAGTPVPASRPRVSRWGTYYTKPYKEWMQAAEKQLGKQPKKYTVKDPCHATIWVRCKKAKTSKLQIPRGDIDNFAKAALDALVKARILEDDNLVVYLFVEKSFGSEPYVHIEIDTGINV